MFPFPYLSLKNKEFNPLIRSISDLFHNTYLDIPVDFRLVLLCGKARDTNSNNGLAKLKIILKLMTKPFNTPNKLGNTSRDQLLSYSDKNSINQKYILAENILHDDFSKSGLDLLRGESFLAEIVDCIFIFLESWGTATVEVLGSFCGFTESQTSAIRLQISSLLSEHSPDFYERWQLGGS